MSYEEYYKKEIDNFQRYGEYTYVFDEVGNVVFNSSSGDFSQVFLGLPLQNYIYDNTKILGFYDPSFTEFVPPTAPTEAENLEQVQGELEAEKETTDALTGQLEDLIAASEANSTPSERQATKQVILELRKALGQGNVESDFSPDFPYTPLRKEASMAVETITTVPVAETTTPELPTTVAEIVATPVEVDDTDTEGDNDPTGEFSSGGTGGFLSGGRVSVAKGPTRRINRIRKGSKLLGYGGPAVTVLKRTRKRIKEYLVINNHTRLAPDQSVLVNGKMIDAKDLKVGDVMTRYNGQMEPVSTIQTIKRSTRVFNFVLDNNERYIVNDLVVQGTKGNAK